MSTEKELQMEQEWREQVMLKLNNMEQYQRELKDDIAEIKQSFVRQVAIDKLRDDQKLEIDQVKLKIEALETSKTRMLGIIAGISGVVTLVGWAIGLIILWASGHPL